MVASAYGVEATMNVPEDVMIAGLCLIAAMGAVLAGAWWKAFKQGHGPDLHLDYPRRGTRLDLYMTLVWSGMLLVQASNVLLHVQDGSTHNLSRLSWTGLAASIFVCGVFAGRLLLRLEMHRYNETRDEPVGRISEA
jgi:hypothetical protein